MNRKTEYCLICLQSEEIKTKLIEMRRVETLQHIVEWLETQGVEATINQVQYFLRKNHIVHNDPIQLPRDTYEENIIIFIDELLKVKLKRFTMWTLNLRGPIWAVIFRRLHEDGLLEKFFTKPRAHWELTATRDELLAWRDAELEKIKHP